MYGFIFIAILFALLALSFAITAYLRIIDDKTCLLLTEETFRNIRTSIVKRSYTLKWNT